MNLKEEFWNPEMGDVLEGTLVDVLVNRGKYNNNIYKIKKENVIKIVWGRKQLDLLMESVKIGDLISLKYVGLKKLNDYQMKIYELNKLNEKHAS